MKTILIVEDDEATGSMLVRVVEQETDYAVVLACDCCEALRFSREIKPDLLIIDFQLPTMNGLDLYDQLHEISELQSIPALIVSASSLDKVQLAFRARHLPFLCKPFDLDELLQTIDMLIFGSQQFFLTSEQQVR